MFSLFSENSYVYPHSYVFAPFPPCTSSQNSPTPWPALSSVPCFLFLFLITQSLIVLVICTWVWSHPLGLQPATPLKKTDSRFPSTDNHFWEAEPYVLHPCWKGGLSRSCADKCSVLSHLENPVWLCSPLTSSSYNIWGPVFLVNWALSKWVWYRCLIKVNVRKCKTFLCFDKLYCLGGFVWHMSLTNTSKKSTSLSFILSTCGLYKK